MEKKRNAGIDLLRILAMYLIVVGHVLSKGRILKQAIPFTANYMVLWTIKLITICAVDIFAIISGYVGFQSSSHRYSSLVSMWLRIIFYSFFLTLLLLPFCDELSIVDLLKSFFPVAGGVYWYFNAYIGVLEMSRNVQSGIPLNSET